jgi:hypothetical protein
VLLLELNSRLLSSSHVLDQVFLLLLLQLQQQLGLLLHLACHYWSCQNQLQFGQSPPDVMMMMMLTPAAFLQQQVADVAAKKRRFELQIQLAFFEVMLAMMLEVQL